MEDVQGGIGGEAERVRASTPQNNNKKSTGLIDTKINHVRQEERRFGRSDLK